MRARASWIRFREEGRGRSGGRKQCGMVWWMKEALRKVKGGVKAGKSMDLVGKVSSGIHFSWRSGSIKY